MKRDIILIALALALMTSCKQQKIGHTTPQETANEQISTQVVEAIVASQPKFSTMNIAKLSGQLNINNNVNNIRGSLRIFTDSLISISIQPFLGIEIYRIEFMPTSFKVYDKMGRRFSENTYDFLRYKYNLTINYKTLEALFSHQLFCPEGTDIETLKEAFNISNKNDEIILKSKKEYYNHNLIFKANGENQISGIALSQEDNNLCTVTYSAFDKFNKILFPQELNINIKLNNSIDAIISFEKIIFDKEIDFAPINTQRYTKVAFSDILPF